MFFGVCARALDYFPPVDITFGDFLRAIITADRDLFPSDTYGVRNAVMQAFRSRGIVPEDAQFFSEDALCWPEVRTTRCRRCSRASRAWCSAIPTASRASRRRTTHACSSATPSRMRGRSGSIRNADIEVPSFHPMFRTDEDGSLKVDMVVEMVQPGENRQRRRLGIRRDRCAAA